MDEQQNALAAANPDLPAEAPGEAPPQAQNEETQAQQPAEQETAPDGLVDEPPDPEKLKSEIEGLKRAKEEALAEAIKYRKMKAEAKAELYRQPRQEQAENRDPIPTEAGPEPTEADFDDYSKYIKALTDHRVKVAEINWEKRQSVRAQQQQQQERSESLKARLQEGFEKYPDFEEVAFDPTAVHITPMVVDLLSDCEHPADLAYYLAKNRVEGVAISRMTPTQAARALAKIEAKLESPAPAPQPQQQQQVKRLSGAPAPIKPIGGSATGITKDPNKMTNAEFAAWRASQGARRF